MKHFFVYATRSFDQNVFPTEHWEREIKTAVKRIQASSMTKILTSMFVLTAAFLQIASAQTVGKPIIIGTIESMYSNILEEERKLWIYVPQPSSEKQRYPVLYLLDAESNFNSAAAIVRKMGGRWPEMIIVGIANTDRNRDLTPTQTINYKGSGGGENFIRFIKEELIPHIDSSYNSSSYRLLSGHSLGGLTVANVFANHTEMFNAYIIIDPTLTYDDQKLLLQIEKMIAGKKFANQSLFFGMANNLPPGMDTMTARKDTSKSTLFYRSHLRFVQALQGIPTSELRCKFQFYPGEGHGTVQIIAEYDGLHFLFDYYQFKLSVLMNNPTYNGDSAIIAHFKNISIKLGYPVPPPEGMVNEAGYFYLNSKRYDRAYQLFKLNIDNYPKSFNTYDSMGDFYAAKSDKVKAIEFYTKALNLQESIATRKKLEAIK